MSNKTTPMWADSRVSVRLGIKYPIIQGPLEGLPSQRLTAAGSNYGGLGSFGAHGLAPCAIEEVIANLAEKSSQQDLIPTWAGQSANPVPHTRTSELLDALITSVSAMIDNTAAEGK